MLCFRYNSGKEWCQHSFGSDISEYAIQCAADNLVLNGITNARLG